MPKLHVDAVKAVQQGLSLNPLQNSRLACNQMNVIKGTSKGMNANDKYLIISIPLHESESFFKAAGFC